MRLARPSSPVLTAFAAAAWLLLALPGAAPLVRASDGPPARPELAARLPEAAREDLRFLDHLGWRFVEDAEAREVRVHAGRPCDRPDLAAAQAAGDLRVVLPPRLEGEALAAFGDLLARLADSDASRCAWQLRVHAATRQATRKLAANAERGRFEFPRLLVMTSPWWRLEPPEPEWVRRGDVFVAADSPARAVESFYSRSCVAECYAAQLVATYAIQYELYGPEWFAETFRPEEIAIGTPDAYARTPFGGHETPEGQPRPRALFIRPEDWDEDPAVVLARHGPRAFSGLTGILRDPGGRTRLNENFTIVSLSAEAMEVLRSHGGFSAVAEQTALALESHRAAQNPLISGALLHAHRQRICAVMDSPALSEFVVYIHPYGVLPIREILERKMRQYGAALELRLYARGREDALYERYREAVAARASGGAPR